MSKIKFPDSGAALLSLWQKFQKIPLGKLVFSRIIGRAIPYTGSICPNVEVLEQGHAIVSMRDRRAVRNHLSSIHAIALANIGEYSTGLALISQLPPGMRMILGSLKTDYLKKARGTLHAKAYCANIEVTPKTHLDLVSEIFNSDNICVARVTATWVVGQTK